MEIGDIIKILKEDLGLDLDPFEYEFIYTYPPLHSLKPKKNDFGVNKIFTQEINEPVSIYIHIPFCPYLCHYCYYYKHKVTEDDPEISSYLELLQREIELFKEKVSNKIQVKNIYIGGGTPSLLNVKAIERLMKIINKNFHFLQESEFTFECSPITLQGHSDEKIEILKSHGVNRISMGIQTFNEDILKIIGRDNGREVTGIIEQLLRHFKNINIDLIYGFPGQNVNDIMKDLNELVNKNIPSITCYQLWFKSRTSPVKPLIEFLPKESFPKIETILEMKSQIRNFLVKNGYEEVMSSWFIKNNDQGYINKYQYSAWINEPYLGFGVSAYSYLNGIEFKNRCFLEHYYAELKNNSLPICSGYELNDQEKELRKLILGLKIKNGVDINVNKLSEITKHKINILKSKSLLNEENNTNSGFSRLRLTDDGFYVADYICKYLFEENHLLPKGKSIHCVCGFKRRNIWRDAINVYKDSNFSVDGYEKIMELDENVRNGIIECLFSYVKKYFNSRNKLNILSIGIGSGRLEIPFFEKLVAQGKELNVYAYDINKALLEKFQNTIKNHSNKDKLNLSIKNQDIILADIISETSKFDIVTMFNFIYHLDFPVGEELLNKIDAVTCSNSLIILSFTGGWLESIYKKGGVSDPPFVRTLKEILIKKGIKFEGYYTYWIHNYFNSGYEGHIHRFDWVNNIKKNELWEIFSGEKKVFSFCSLLNEEERQILKKVLNNENIDIPLPMAEILLIIKKLGRER
jgi:oxygen-independent coproporphyrinogen-3 oxidase